VQLFPAGFFDGSEVAMEVRSAAFKITKIISLYEGIMLKIPESADEELRKMLSSHALKIQNELGVYLKATRDMNLSSSDIAQQASDSFKIILGSLKSTRVKLRMKIDYIRKQENLQVTQASLKRLNRSIESLAIIIESMASMINTVVIRPGAGTIMYPPVRTFRNTPITEAQELFDQDEIDETITSAIASEVLNISKIIESYVMTIDEALDRHVEEDQPELVDEPEELFGEKDPADTMPNDQNVIDIKSHLDSQVDNKDSYKGNFRNFDQQVAQAAESKIYKDILEKILYNGRRRR
jgi:hypothetical protein